MMHETHVQTRRAADLLVDCLLEQGVERAFCVPGESYLAVLDALYERKERISLVVCRNEAGASTMADAYGKLIGRPGVCFVTRGPGATNASIGIHTAFQDSTPLVMFIGQVSRKMRHREGFQEVDFAAMYGPLAKWAVEIDDASRIPEYIHRAFQTAMAGRPGPVVIALPEDMLSDLVQAPRSPAKRAEPISSSPTPHQLEKLSDLLADARKPLMIVGGGGWSHEIGARIASFSERFGIAVVASLRCQDYVSNRHPNYVGHLAIVSEPSLVARMSEADLLFVMGARLGEMTTAGYTLVDPTDHSRPLIHVYPDPEELGRVYQADLAINADASGMVEALDGLTVPPKHGRQDWVAACRADYEASFETPQRDTAIDMARIVSTMRDRMPDDTIVCSGAGNYTGWVHRYWPFTTYRSQLAPTSGAMGYGVPAAVAASILHPDRSVVCFAGDGCFQMTFQEMATAAQYGARILFVIVNNGMYGTIRMHQEREFPERVHGTEIFNPDFVGLAQAYGFHAERVEHDDQFTTALEAALAAPGSALIELVTEQNIISVRGTIASMREKALASRSTA